ncbi:MAG: 3-deoxy-8-phosphooctulonate synthase [Francisellaceae bacterium]|jgi:2-dehydro-3-deoxyphosphooctonate aldolase (KDO 8-P synthase)|nr:3-deoxy-8-phosphooctulonate synthase [Francisellaceae bacterium]MBT6207989.1 3-deoxy-8-phosphooctulonate synthase [Francisellaceae bacterium]MBT6537977.1 3-deoxy-8-phosphooctulonate synthase [Francisellaceae bacterium]
MKVCNFEVGNDKKLFLMAGPCVIESESLCLEVAGHLKEITEKLGINYVFKASFDKANRTSHNSFRGPGVEKGLKILESIKNGVGVPVVTDVHEDTPIDEVASVVDILQTPAFLCRQTNFIQRVAKTKLPINIKKGQFLSPNEMVHVINKAKAVGNDRVFACERGFSFGYNNLIVDMRSLEIMKENMTPVVFDATHSVQLPGGANGATGGQREFIPVLARAAIAVGIAGLFMETHPDPDKAMSDGPNSVPLANMEALLERLLEIDAVIKK